MLYTKERSNFIFEVERTDTDVKIIKDIVSGNNSPLEPTNNFAIVIFEKLPYRYARYNSNKYAVIWDFASFSLDTLEVCGVYNKTTDKKQFKSPSSFMPLVTLQVKSFNKINGNFYIVMNGELINPCNICSNSLLCKISNSKIAEIMQYNNTFSLCGNGLAKKLLTNSSSQLQIKPESGYLPLVDALGMKKLRKNSAQNMWKLNLTNI